MPPPPPPQHCHLNQHLSFKLLNCTSRYLETKDLSFSHLWKKQAHRGNRESEVKELSVSLLHYCKVWQAVSIKIHLNVYTCVYLICIYVTGPRIGTTATKYVCEIQHECSSNKDTEHSVHHPDCSWHVGGRYPQRDGTGCNCSSAAVIYWSLHNAYET